MGLKVKKNVGGRILITVNVLGSAGPIRFLVNDDEHVAVVVHTALKSYAREGRRPVLGSNLNSFILYCVNSGYVALGPEEPIGLCGSRKFVLCKKPEDEMVSASADSMIVRKSSGSWKSWINKSLGFMIPSH